MNCVMIGANNCKATFVTALEAAYDGGGPLQQFAEIVFSRVRIVVTPGTIGLRADNLYQFDHPYGTEQLTSSVNVDAAGNPTGFGDFRRPGFTRDIMGAVADFNPAMSGDVGPFWVPTPFNGGPNGSFLNAALALTTIKSSGAKPIVNGHPYFRITDLGPIETDAAGVAVSSLQQEFTTALGYTQGRDAQGHPYVQYNLFTIQGQIPTVIGVSLNSADYSLGAGNNAVNIWANSAASQSLSADLGTAGIIPLVEDLTHREATTAVTTFRASVHQPPQRPAYCETIRTSPLEHGGGWPSNHRPSHHPNCNLHGWAVYSQKRAARTKSTTP